MLVLSRKVGEQLVIGENIVVEVMRVRGGDVRLGIQAPPDIKVWRSELLAQAHKEGPSDAKDGGQPEGDLHDPRAPGGGAGD